LGGGKGSREKEPGTKADAERLADSVGKITKKKTEPGKRAGEKKRGFEMGRACGKPVGVAKMWGKM